MRRGSGGGAGDSLSPDQVYRSLRRTTAEIQSYSYDATNTSGKVADTASHDSGISQMSDRHDDILWGVCIYILIMYSLCIMYLMRLISSRKYISPYVFYMYLNIFNFLLKWVYKYLLILFAIANNKIKFRHAGISWKLWNEYFSPILRSLVWELVKTVWEMKICLFEILI